MNWLCPAFNILTCKQKLWHISGSMTRPRSRPQFVPDLLQRNAVSHRPRTSFLSHRAIHILSINATATAAGADCRCRGSRVWRCKLTPGRPRFVSAVTAKPTHGTLLSCYALKFSFYFTIAASDLLHSSVPVPNGHICSLSLFLESTRRFP